MFVQIIGNKPVRPQGLSEKTTNFVVESVQLDSTLKCNALKPDSITLLS